MQPPSKPEADRRATVFVVDADILMDDVVTNHPLRSALDIMKNLIIATISRNLFAKSDDLFGIVHLSRMETESECGSAEEIRRRTVLCKCDELEPASIELLDYVDRKVAQPEEEASADSEQYLRALEKALGLIEGCRTPLRSRSLVFMHYGRGPLPSDLTSYVLTRCHEIQCEFTVIGRHSDVAEDSSLSYKWLPLENAVSGIRSFRVQNRASPPLKIPIFVDQDKIINVNMLRKHVTAKPQWNITGFDLPQTDFRKLEIIRDEVKGCVDRFFNYVDETTIPYEQELNTVKLKAKPLVQTVRERAEEYAEAFNYGADKIIFNQADLAALKHVHEERSLKLISFLDKKQIHPQLLMAGSGRYLLPFSGEPAHIKAFSTLVDGMLKTDTVALVRYVYRDGAKPMIGVLTPKMNKKRFHMCSLGILPFLQDIRHVSFPSLRTCETSSCSSSE